MTFLWAAPGGAGTPPPASVEHLAPAVAPAPVAPAVPEAPVATRVFFWANGKHRKMVDLYGFMRNLWAIHGIYGDLWSIGEFMGDFEGEIEMGSLLDDDKNRQNWVENEE